MGFVDILREAILRILSCLFILVFVTAIGASDVSAAAKNSKKPQENPRYASIIMDADTGMILRQRYADKSLHPASLTKIMTLLMVFEAMDRSEIKKTDRIRISQRAASMVPSKLGLPAGSSIKVEDAIYALVTKSANDIAVAVGEHIGGSESKFAAMMTARAHTIGMSKTRFKNASGLHDPGQVSSARDMAKLARYILHRYPHYYRYFSTKSFTYQGKTYQSHNRLMSSYKGMDGFKTGYINASGFNLVASANRDGRRLIGVVFGGRTSKSRNDHMASILDEGFEKAGRIRVARVDPPLPQVKPSYGLASMQAKPVMPQNTKVGDGSYTSLAALGTNTKIITGQKPSETVTPNYTALTQALQSGAFGEMIGEGDFDPSVSKRLETGLIAIAVHKGEYKPNPNPASAVEKSLRNVGHAMVAKMGQEKQEQSAAAPAKTNQVVTLPHPKDIVGTWAIQIGAYNSRVATDEALRDAQRKLPKKLTKATPMAVPLRTAEGLIFRARLGGLTEDEAIKACRYFKDCMPVAPLGTRVSNN